MAKCHATLPGWRGVILIHVDNHRYVRGNVKRMWRISICADADVALQQQLTLSRLTPTIRLFSYGERRNTRRATQRTMFKAVFCR